MQSDPRIPVTFLADAAALPAWLGAGGPAALLTDAPGPATGPVTTETFTARAMHRFGCTCCAGRSAAAIALDRLFQGRARGRIPWFERVAILGTEAAHGQVAAALKDDALTLARFRAV